MKRYIVLVMLMNIIFNVFPESRNSMEMSSVIITGSYKADKESLSKQVYSVDSLFSDPQIKEILVDSSLNIRDLGSIGSLITLSISGARSSQTAKMLDGVLLNSPANGDFDVSWIEKEMLSSIRVDHSPFNLNGSGSGSGGAIDFSGINYAEDILGVSFGSDKYKKTYLKKKLSEDSSLFISNKEYRGETQNHCGRQNTFYLKKNKEHLKVSLWYSDRKQYLAGSSLFPTPGNYNDSNIFVFNIQNRIKGNIRVGLSTVNEKNSLYEKVLDMSSPTETSHYTIFLNKKIRTSEFKFTCEILEGESEQFADTDFDGVWDTQRGYDKDEEIYSFSFHKNIKDSIKLSAKVFSRENQEFEEFTALKEFSGSSLILGNRYSVPTFNDLYWPNTGFVKGNVNLESESMDFIEYQKKINGLSIDICYNSYEDLIEWMPDNSGVWRPVNLSKATVESFGIRYDVNENITLQMKRKRARDGNGNYLIYRPMIDSLFRYRKDDLDLALEYTGKRFINGRWYGGFSILDLSYSDDRFYITVENLFDKKYISTLNYPLGKRSVFFGVRKKI